MEADEEALRRNREAFEASTAATNRLAEALGVKRNSTRGATKPGLGSLDKGGFNFKAMNSALTRHTDGLANTFRTLGGSAESLMGGFDRLLRNVVGGAVAGQILTAGIKLVDSYKKLTDIGQTFGGSMFEMAAQAGAAGLPLSEFSRMLEKNSTAAAVLATRSATTGTTLGTLQTAVRDSTRDVGFYGMSLSNITDLTGDYTETLRLQGRAANLNNQQTAQQIKSFAKDISDFATVTGKSRMAIAKATNEAMRDVGYAAREFSTAQQESGRRAITFMASLPGTAGDMMSKMLSQTIAYGGAIFADDMKVFAEAGQAGFLSILDGIAQKTNRGGPFNEADEAENLVAMQTYYKNNKTNLLTQARAGNQQARQVLKILQDIEGIDAKTYAAKRRAQEQFGEFTKFFTKIEDALSVLSGQFVEGLMQPLKELDQTGAKFPDLIKMFSAEFKSAGVSVGNFIKDFVQPENLRAMADTIKMLMKFGNGLLDAINVLMIPIKGLIGLFTGMSKILKSVFGEGAGSTLTGVMGVMLLFSRKIYGLFQMLKLGEVKINAAHASINVGSVGQGGLGGGFGGGAGPVGPDGRAPPGAPTGRKATLRERFRAGFAKHRGGRLATLAQSALGGSAGCCDGLSSGIAKLTDSVDFHGDRTHSTLTEADNLGGKAKGRFGRALERSTGFLKGAANRTGGFLAEHAGSLLGRGAKVGAMGLRGAKALLGGPGGLIAMTAGLAIDKLVPEGTRGKNTAALALERGAMGAMIGSFIPGIGTVIGGALGGLEGAIEANYDDIKKTLIGDRNATPATPNDTDNPYSTSSPDQLRDQYQEVTQQLAASVEAQSSGMGDLLASADASRALQQQIADLTAQQTQISTLASRRLIDLNRRQLAAAETTAQAVN